MSASLVIGKKQRSEKSDASSLSGTDRDASTTPKARAFIDASGRYKAGRLQQAKHTGLVGRPQVGMVTEPLIMGMETHDRMFSARQEMIFEKQ